MAHDVPRIRQTRDLPAEAAWPGPNGNAPAGEVPTVDSESAADRKAPKDAVWAVASYALFLAGLVVPIAPVIAVIVCYLQRGHGPGWLDSHYTFGIRTFWYSLLATFVGVLTTVLFVGFVLLALTLCWYVVRCIRGLSLLSRRLPVPNPVTWIW